uniref:Uncharacterized protein n=1 Tax=Brassica oleracea TaxID=3712 RepID=A0A3P6EEM5_BRAOL|nr:unnamed protein product [Brassica oleracea]
MPSLSRSFFIFLFSLKTRYWLLLILSFTLQILMDFFSIIFCTNILICILTVVLSLPLNGCRMCRMCLCHRNKHLEEHVV